jgi:hypothetical protein
MKRFLVVFVALLMASVLAQSTIGSFVYVKQIDQLTDSDASYISTQESRDPKRVAQLQLRCQQNSQTKQTDLFIALEHNLKLPQYYSSYAQVRWQYRFDKNPASSEWLSYFSEDQTRIYLTDDTRADFIAQAKKSQRLVMVITGDEITPQTFNFNLEKFGEALAKLKCKVQSN